MTEGPGFSSGLEGVVVAETLLADVDGEGGRLLARGHGLHRRLFTPVFAAARVAGWLAHVAEQRLAGRIMRPRCRYVGPIPDAA